MLCYHFRGLKSTYYIEVLSTSLNFGQQSLDEGSTCMRIRSASCQPIGILLLDTTDAPSFRPRDRASRNLRSAIFLPSSYNYYCPLTQLYHSSIHANLEIGWHHRKNTQSGYLSGQCRKRAVNALFARSSEFVGFVAPCHCQRACIAVRSSPAGRSGSTMSFLGISLDATYVWGCMNGSVFRDAIIYG
jgi:hypothetical protein